MVVSTPQRRTTRHPRPAPRLSLDVEALRDADPSIDHRLAGFVNPVAETEPNDTLATHRIWAISRQRRAPK